MDGPITTVLPATPQPGQEKRRLSPTKQNLLSWCFPSLQLVVGEGLNISQPQAQVLQKTHGRFGAKWELPSWKYGEATVLPLVNLHLDKLLSRRQNPDLLARSRGSCSEWQVGNSGWAFAPSNVFNLPLEGAKEPVVPLAGKHERPTELQVRFFSWACSVGLG